MRDLELTYELVKVKLRVTW